jgi:hypothetical protein
VLVDLDYHAAPWPRWGYGRPPHPQLYALLDAGRSGYAARLEQLLAFRADLERIPQDETAAAPGAPFWNNPWFTGLDGVALYGFLRIQAPRLYLEVGSGTSTKFVRRAIVDGSLRTRIVSIDPQPRAEVDQLCDEVIRRPLEELSPETFNRLQPGDVLFMDGSHRAFMNSDAVVFFLEALPRLPERVLVHVHDVFLPYDYPPEWNDRFYSEQYLLAAWLLGGGRSVSVELPNAFISHDQALRTIIAPVCPVGSEAQFHLDGSFWFSTSRSRETVVAQAPERAIPQGRAYSDGQNPRQPECFA